MNIRMKNIIAKYYEISLPIKSAIGFTIASFLEKGISLITTPIFTRLLSSSDYGLISVFNSWLGIIIIFTTLNLTHGTLNSAMINFKEERDSYLSSTLILSNVCTLVVFVIYLFSRDWVNQLVGLPFNLMLLIFIYSFLNPGLNFWVSKKRYLYEYKIPLFLMSINAFLSPIISILLVISSDNNKAETKIWSALIITLFFSVYYYIKILNDGKKIFSKKYWNFALSMAVPLVPHYLSLIVLASSDKIMISKIIGLEATGFYSVAYTIGSTVAIFWGAINSSLIPWTYERLSSNNLKGIKKRVNILIFGYVAVCIIIILFAPELLAIMAPSRYFEAVNVIPPVIAGVYYTSLYSLFANVEFYHRKTKFVMFASVVSAIVNLGLNYIFIPQFGYIAAAYTTLFAYVINAICHYYFMKRIDDRDIYDMKAISVSSLFLTVISVLILPFYNYIVFRYFSILSIILLIFIFRKKVIKALKFS